MLTIKRWILRNYVVEEADIEEGAPTKSKKKLLRYL